MVDEQMDDRERDAIRRVLNEISGLGQGEVELVMELALSQVRCRTALKHNGQRLFSEEQARHFMDSMHAVASADGEVSPAELREIQTVARELGFPVNP